ncbi:hypothetical protein FDZ84_34260 [Saccharopolyspora sp. ASAGF58]|nr:hypothetical protein FDZ84_34260 [Saccharopolyspora sp. ASAGF58]
MRVMAQIAMVMNLDKCIGCHTCTVTCKQTWTNRPGAEYIYFNNVETKPGGRATLLPIRGQCRTAQALAHVERAHALLPRPRMDPRVRRGAADVPTTAELPSAFR